MARKHARVKRTPSKPFTPQRLLKPLPAYGEGYRLGLKRAFTVFLVGLPFLHWQALSQINPWMTAQFFAAALFLVVWGLFWLYGLWQGYFSLYWQRWMWSLVVWLGVGAWATLVSPMPFRSFMGTYSTWSDGLAFQVVVVAILMSVLSLRWSEKERKGLWLALLFQAAFLSFRTLFELRMAEQGGFVRITGPLGNSDYWLAYLLLFLPFSTTVAIAWWRESRPLGQRLAGFVLPLVLILSFFAALPNELQQRVIPTEVASTEPVQLGLQSAGEFLDNPSNSERFAQWRMAAYLGSQHLLTGIGPGTLGSHTAEAVLALNLTSSWQANLLMERAHNDFLEEYAVKGVPGASIYLLWWGLVLWVVGKAVWRRKQSEEISVYLGVLALLVFQQVFFTTVPTSLILWTFVALLLTPSMVDGVNVLSVQLGRSISVVVYGVILLLGYWVAQYYRAEGWARLASAAEREGRYDVATVAGSRMVEAVPYEPLYAWYTGYTSYQLSFAGNQELTQEERIHVTKLSRGYFQRALELDPFLPYYGVYEAASAMVFAEPNSAEEHQARERLEKKLSQASRFAELQAVAADAYILKGNLEAGEHLLRRAYELQASDYRKERLEEFLKFK